MASFRKSAPVSEGEIVEVSIESVGQKGDGIARIDGFVVFVRNAKQGERLKVKITKVLENVGFGEIAGKAEGSAKSPSGYGSRSEYKKSPIVREEEKKEPVVYEDSEDF